MSNNICLFKVLCRSKLSINTGKVMELLCNDTQRLVTMAERFLPYVVRMIILTSITICWLLYFGGWQVIPGTILLVVLGVFRLVLFDLDVNLRTRASQLGEKRLGLVREVLTIISLVKMNCLEHVYEEKISTTRW